MQEYKDFTLEICPYENWGQNVDEHNRIANMIQLDGRELNKKYGGGVVFLFESQYPNPPVKRLSDSHHDYPFVLGVKERTWWPDHARPTNWKADMFTLPFGSGFPDPKKYKGDFKKGQEKYFNNVPNCECSRWDDGFPIYRIIDTIICEAYEELLSYMGFTVQDMRQLHELIPDTLLLELSNREAVTGYVAVMKIKYNGDPKTISQKLSEINQTIVTRMYAEGYSAHCQEIAGLDLISLPDHYKRPRTQLTANLVNITTNMSGTLLEVLRMLQPHYYAHLDFRNRDKVNVYIPVKKGNNPVKKVWRKGGNIYDQVGLDLLHSLEAEKNRLQNFLLH